MTKTMRALVFRGPNNYDIEQKEIPPLDEGDVLLKVIACGLCGTDVKIFNNGHRAVRPPLTTGHEVVGTVVETKSQRPDIQTGDNVIVVTPVGCMNCKFCAQGMQNMCSWVANDVHSLGYYIDGGFAEYMRIPREAVHQGVVIKIPDTAIPLSHFALCEPLSCVINGQEKLKIKPGETVVIVGAGPIGCMHAYLAKAGGAGKIILADIDAKKLEITRGVPADVRVDTSKNDFVQVVREHTNGAGADVVIVAAPSGNAQENAVRIAGILGRISFFAGLPKNAPCITLDSNAVHYKEQEIYGAFASHRRQYEDALALILDKKVDSSLLVTHTFSLDRIRDAVTLAQKGEAVKIVIAP